MTAEADAPSILSTRITARLETLGLSQTGASREAGLSASGIRNIIEGKSVSPRTSTLQAVARVLQTTPEWLLGQDGSDLPAATVTADVKYQPAPEFFDNSNPIPLYTSAEGGDNGSIIIDPAPIDWLPRPHILDNIEQAYAILITGESMVPAFRPGERAWVNPRLPMMRGEDHIFRSEDRVTGEWRAMIKEMRSWTKTAWHVAQHNPRKVFDLDRGLWQRCHRVVGKFARP